MSKPSLDNFAIRPDVGHWAEPMEVLRDFRSFTEMKIATGIPVTELFDSPREVLHMEELLKSVELALDQLAVSPEAKDEWEACFDEIMAYRSWFEPLLQRAGLNRRMH